MMTFNKWLRENYGRENHRCNGLLMESIGGDYPWRKGYEGQMAYPVRAGVFRLSVMRSPIVK